MSGLSGRGAVGKQFAGLIDDGNALRLQAIDGGRDQVADGPHLLRLERPAHLEHDRGGGIDLVTREQRPFRKHQMHTRRLHAVDGCGWCGTSSPSSARR